MKFKLNIWQIATIVLLFLFLWQWQCKGRKAVIKEKIVYEKVQAEKTVKNPEPKSEVQKPVPQKIPVYVKVPVNVPGPKGETIYRTDTFWKPVDTAAILNDYYVERTYEEEFPFDTGSLKGKVKVTSTVGENKLNLQTAAIDFEIKHKEKEVRRTVFLLGLDALGSRENYGAGANGWIKNKKNQMFGAGVKKIEGLPMMYEAGFKMPISFRK